jgi:hypothetical protein
MAGNKHIQKHYRSVVWVLNKQERFIGRASKRIDSQYRLKGGACLLSTANRVELGSQIAGYNPDNVTRSVTRSVLWPQDDR